MRKNSELLPAKYLKRSQVTTGSYIETNNNTFDPLIRFLMGAYNSQPLFKK